MKKPPVDIIIASHSNKEQLTRCLEFVYTQKYGGMTNIVLVDNASKDNSVFVVSSRYPQVKIVLNNENIGLGAAINQGLSITSSPYVGVIHQDVELEENWVSELVAAIESDEKIGSACALVSFRKSKGSRKETESAGIGFRNGKPIQLDIAVSKETPRLKNIHSVFGVPGAAGMYKREMLEKIRIKKEIFDEDLFSCYEDFDVALRAYFHGYTSIFTPDTSALHKRGILRENDPEAQINRDILEACNPALVYYKCLPYDVFVNNKKQIRKRLRSGLWGLTKVHGAAIGMQAMNYYRSCKRKMLKKQALIFDKLDVNLDAIEWEVFGKK